MNNTSELTTFPKQSIEDVIAKTVIDGDLSRLSPRERVLYYNAVCQSLGLNPMTKPFELIKLNGKLTLYARKDCTDQMRRLHKISIEPPHTQVINNEVFVVTVTAKTADGRTDTEIGAVSIKGLTGDSLCNAMMKGVTKAKRRVTLGICGLGMLDATETETIPGAVVCSSSDIDIPEVWRNWKSPEDAILWASTVLPDYTGEELQRLFDELPAINNKKALAWVEKVLEMAVTF